MTTRSSASALISAWLARAHENPESAQLGWDIDQVALLPLGRRFDAVRIPVAIVYAAMGSGNRAAVGPLLEAVLDGPVIQDREIYAYALVPTGGAAAWSAPTGTYLARSWLTVPRTDQLAPPGMWWAVEMRTPGRLCALAAVMQLIETGFRRLAGEPS